MSERGVSLGGEESEKEETSRLPRLFSSGSERSEGGGVVIIVGRLELRVEVTVVVVMVEVEVEGVGEGEDEEGVGPGVDVEAEAGIGAGSDGVDRRGEGGAARGLELLELSRWGESGALRGLFADGSR